MYAAYLWVKTIHLVLVMAWVAAVFYLPRILIHLSEAGDAPDVRSRLLLMGRRLYRFGHVMAALAFILGLVLWLGWRWWTGFPAMVGPASGWMHVKLTLIVLLFAHYLVAGRWLKGTQNRCSLPSTKVLRWFNEIPLLLLIAIVWLVLAKPF